MCLVHDADGNVELLSESSPAAKIEHKCNECHRIISPGERYHNERFIWDGRFSIHKTCAHCMVIRCWLNDECGGWLYGAVGEDIIEHAANGGYPIGVYRLAVGVKWKWRSRSGKLLPVPVMPKTTHERMRAA